MRTTRAALGAMVLAGMGAWAGYAEACTRACVPGSVWPTQTVRPRVTLPANLPALGWWMPEHATSQAGFTFGLTRDGMTPATLTMGLEAQPGSSRVMAVRPTMPWVEGAQYTFLVSGPCNSEGAVGNAGLMFEVGPAIPLPTQLGRVTVAMTEQVPGATVLPDSFNGSCGTQAEIAHRTVTLEVAPEAQSWARWLYFQTVIDGRVTDGPLRERGGEGIGTVYTLPYVVCRGPASTLAYALTPGVHRFQFRALLLGSDVVLNSEEVSAEIVCGPLLGDAGSEDASASVDASVTVDAPMVQDNGNVAVDAAIGAPVQDAGVRSDTGTEVQDAGTQPQGEGAGCSTSPRSTRTPALWMAAVALGLGLVRRRRA